MKYILLFNLLVLLAVLRATRGFGDINSKVFPWIEATVISNCRANGRIDEANILPRTYEKMRTCLKNISMFIISKDKYITHIEECSEDSMNHTKGCLSDEHKYFPEFVLDLVKSAVNFMYNNIDIIHVDLAACMHKFMDEDVQRSYIQCLTDIATQFEDNAHNMPTLKATFCEKFIPASECYTNMVKKTCDRTTNLDQFREDYINAIKRPCDKKESFQ